MYKFISLYINDDLNIVWFMRTLSFLYVYMLDIIR